MVFSGDAVFREVLSQAIWKILSFVNIYLYLHII